MDQEAKQLFRTVDKIKIRDMINYRVIIARRLLSCPLFNMNSDVKLAGCDVKRRERASA